MKLCLGGVATRPASQSSALTERPARGGAARGAQDRRDPRDPARYVAYAAAGSPWCHRATLARHILPRPASRAPRAHGRRSSARARRERLRRPDPVFGARISTRMSDLGAARAVVAARVLSGGGRTPACPGSSTGSAARAATTGAISSRTSTTRRLVQGEEARASGARDVRAASLGSCSAPTLRTAQRDGPARASADLVYRGMNAAGVCAWRLRDDPGGA